MVKAIKTEEGLTFTMSSSKNNENSSYESVNIIPNSTITYLKTSANNEAFPKSEEILVEDEELKRCQAINLNEARIAGSSCKNQLHIVTEKVDEDIAVENNSMESLSPIQPSSLINVEVSQSVYSNPMQSQSIRAPPQVSTSLCPHHQAHGPPHHHIFSGYMYSIPVGPHGTTATGTTWPVIEAPLNIDSNGEFRHFCPAHPQGPVNRENCVLLQMDGGVPFPVQITSKRKAFRSNTSPHMISQGRQSQLSVPLPVPQSQVVSQIVNENATLAHVMLSPCPRLPGQGGIPHIHTSFVNGSNTPQHFYNPIAPNYPPHGNITHPSPGPACVQTQQIVHSSQSKSLAHKDERAQKLHSKLLKTSERRDVRSSSSNSAQFHPSRQGIPNGACQATGSGDLATGEAEDKEDGYQLLTDILSTVRAPEVTDISSRSAILRWGPPLNIHALNINEINLLYFVLLSDRSKEGKYKIIFRGNSFVCMIQDLRPGQDYFVCLQVIYEQQEGFPSEPTAFKTPSCEPDPPSAIKLFSRAKNSMQLRWSAPSDNGSTITHYILEYDEGKGKSFKEVVQTKGRQYTIVKLQPSTRYNFRLCAVNEIGKSSFSDIAMFSTSCNPPPIPSPPSLLSATSNSLQLAWNRRTSDDKYILQICNRESGYGFLTLYNGTETQYECADLRRATEFRFRLRSVNDAGQSAWSIEAMYKTLPERPSKPSKLQVKGKIHGTLFKVKWDPPIDKGGGEIQIYHAEIGNGKSFECFYSGKDTEAICDGLTPGMVYQLRVSCSSPAGISEFSDILTVMTETIAPSVMESPYLVTPSGPCKAVLKWNRPENNGGASIQKYEILLIGKNHDNTIFCCGKELCYILRDLCPGENYEACVRAYNKSGCSLWSKAAIFKTSSAPPSPPDLANIDVRSPFHIYVAWNEPVSNGAPILTYSLEISEREEVYDQFHICYRGANTSIDLQTLLPCTLYYFRVCAMNATGTSLYSNVLTAQTPASTPSQPILETYVVTSNEIKLNWSEPSANGSPILYYNIEYGETIIRTESNSREYKIIELLPETVYKFKVQAVNAIGGSIFSTSVKVTTLPPPPDPPTLSCSGVGHNFIKLKWGEGRNVDYILYDVEMFNNRTKQFQTVYKGTSFICKVNKLQEQRTYMFRICAESDRAGIGNFSPNYDFSTTVALPNSLKAPRIRDEGALSTSLLQVCANSVQVETADKLNTGTIALEWQHSRNNFSDPVEYVLEHSSGGENAYQEIYRGGETQLAVCHLNPELTHWFRVYPIRIKPTGEQLPGIVSNSLKSHVRYIEKIFRNSEISPTHEIASVNLMPRNRLVANMSIFYQYFTNVEALNTFDTQNSSLQHVRPHYPFGYFSKRLATNLASLYWNRRRFTDQEKAVLWMMFFIVMTVGFAVLVRILTR